MKRRYTITISHSYAVDGRPLSEELIVEGRTYSLARSYDTANRVATQTFADGNVMAWGYDDRNLVTGLTYDAEPVLSQIHVPSYRLAQQTFGNGPDPAHHIRGGAPNSPLDA